MVPKARRLGHSTQSLGPQQGRDPNKSPARSATFAAPGPLSVHQAESANWARRRMSSGSQNPRGLWGPARGQEWTPGSEQGLRKCQKRRAMEGVHFTCALQRGCLCASLPLGQQPARRSGKYPESSASTLAGPERDYTACWREGIYHASGHTGPPREAQGGWGQGLLHRGDSLGQESSGRKEGLGRVQGTRWGRQDGRGRASTHRVPVMPGQCLRLHTHQF